MIISVKNFSISCCLINSFMLMPIWLYAQQNDTSKFNTNNLTTKTYQCYNFSAIEIEGNNVVSSKKLYKEIDKYLNQCLDLNDIKEAVAGDILALYQQEGYILAIPYFPDQNLNSGVLKIVIKEGILNEIIYDAEVLSPISVKNAFWGQKNSAFNIRDVEKSLEILNGSGAYFVQMDIAPGEEEGYSDLILKGSKSKKYSGYITITNDYNTLDDTKFPKKEARVIIGGSIGDLIINDTLSLSANSNLDGNSNKQAGSFSINYKLPISSYAIALGNTTDLLKTILEQTQFTTINRTNTFASYFELSKVFSRGQSYKFGGKAKLNSYNTRNYIDGLLLRFSSYDLYYEDLGIDFIYYYDIYTFNLNFIYTHGQPLFGQEKMGKNPQEFEQNLFDLYYFTLDTTLSFPKYALSYNNKLIVQYSNDVLYSFKDINITGSGGVRGYEGVNFTWSSGFINQNDVTYNIINFDNKYIAGISALFAIDFGAPVDETTGRLLTSKGNPLFAWYSELKTTGKIATSLGYGRPLIKEEFVDKNQQVIRFSLGYNF